MVRTVSLMVQMQQPCRVPKASDSFSRSNSHSCSLPGRSCASMSADWGAGSVTESSVRFLPFRSWVELFLADLTVTAGSATLLLLLGVEWGGLRREAGVDEEREVATRALLRGASTPASRGDTERELK